MWSLHLKRCVHCAVVTLLHSRHKGLTSTFMRCRLAEEELRLRGLGEPEVERSPTGFLLLRFSCSLPKGHFILLRLLRMTQVSLQLLLTCCTASSHPECSIFVPTEEIITSLGLQGLQGESFLTRRAGSERLSVLRFHKSWCLGELALQNELASEV